MTATNIVLLSILVANFIFAVIVVFYERKRPSEMLAWILLFVFLPVIGFLLYMLIGQRLFTRRSRFALEPGVDDRLERLLEEQRTTLERLRTEGREADVPGDYGMVYLNVTRAEAPLTDGNNVTIFSHGRDKFTRLFEDIKRAKHFIHMEYFIWRGNTLGRELVQALAERARKGVNVRLILDDWGCKLTPKSVFAPLLEAGGTIHRFLPVTLAWAFNANYRNHRKIVVIDGKIGYVGGMNVGDEYLGLRPSMSPWRDTHLRIEGPAVNLLQARFLKDYRFVTGKDLVLDRGWVDGEPVLTNAQGAMQIVCSGPDSDKEHIKQAFLKMISLARQSLYVQTPYLVPDEPVLTALKLAAFSGVDVRIMIPGRPNNPIVHRVSMAYAGELLEAGARIFLFRGFLHSKMIVTDARLVTIGTSNMDVRSFTHNFETNAFLYDIDKAREAHALFEEDQKAADEMTLEEYKQRAVTERFLESVSRLFAPLM